MKIGKLIRKRREGKKRHENWEKTIKSTTGGGWVLVSLPIDLVKVVLFFDYDKVKSGKR